MRSVSGSKADQDIFLRELVEADVSMLVEHLNRPEIAEWLAAVPQPFAEEHAALLFDLARAEGTVLSGIEIGGKFAGCLCLGVNTWFWLAPKFWQKGMMEKALQAAINAYFTRPAPPLLATVRLDNHASGALLKKLGFGPLPDHRRMFFQASGTSHWCQDYVLAPEQWHLMQPPRLVVDGATLQSATQKHGADLARILPNAQPWSGADLPAFIETNRFRGGFSGLFVILDDHRQMIGAALLQPPATIISTFISRKLADRLLHSTEDALREKFG